MKWLRRLRCKLFRHSTGTTYKKRRWAYTRKNKHIRFEYALTCTRCGTTSKWMPWKNFPVAPKGWKNEWHQNM